MGSFLLDLAWEPSIIDDPVFDGVLKDYLGAETAMVFTNVDPIAATADALTEDLLRGWYGCIVKVYDDTVLSTGFADVVRIAAGYQTAGDVFVHAVEGHGEIEVIIDTDFFTPLALDATPAPGTILFYEPIDFDVWDDDGHSLIAFWYRNGEQLGTGVTFQLDTAGLVPGESYRVDVIAFSTDGKHAGHLSWDVERTEVTFDVIGTFEASAGGLPYAIRVSNPSGSIIFTGSGTTLAPPALTPFSVNAPTPGDYILQVCEDLDSSGGVSSGEKYEYWEEKPNEVDLIAVPIIPVETEFPMGTLNYIYP